MTTQELVERLRDWIEDNAAIEWPYPTLPHERIGALIVAAHRLSEMEAENKRLREALQYVDDCFNAALTEGWIDAKENGDVERIRDLWQRRISYAWSNTLNVLQDRAALTQEKK